MCFSFLRFSNIPDSGLSLLSLGVSVCTHTRQVEHQRCSRTGRVQKNVKILRKNTIFNEHLVLHREISNNCFCNILQQLKRLESTKQPCTLNLVSCTLNLVYLVRGKQACTLNLVSRTLNLVYLVSG